MWSRRGCTGSLDHLGVEVVHTVPGDSETPAADLRTVDVCGAGACATGDLPADQADAPAVRTLLTGLGVDVPG